MKTIVPDSVKAAAISNPNYPKFERIMKRAYGSDWELVTHEEAAVNKARTEYAKKTR